MSDPISRLDQFRADTPGAPMKSAAEVRQRGDQIRRRQRTLVAAGAVALAAVVAGPIIFLSAGFGDKAIEPQPAPAPSQTPSTVAPSPSASAPASDLTRANLPSEDDLVAEDPYPQWVLEQTYDGEGRGDHNECLPALADSGALATFRRDFIAEAGQEYADSAGTLKAVVAEFGSADEAEKARAELSDAASSCTAVDGTEVAGSLPVEGGVVTGGDINVVTYLSEDPNTNAGWEVATAVVAVEDRLVVITRRRGAQDYVSPTTLQTSAVNAAYRLVGSSPPPATASSSASSSSSSSASAPAAVLSDAHLVVAGSLPGLPMEGESSAVWQQVAPQPTPTLYCQGAWLSSLKAAESVSREFRLENPDEIGKVNVTVLEFASKKSADAAYETVHGWLDTCPATMDDAKLFTARPVEAIEIGTTPEIDRAAQTLAEYAADCGGEGCDATWYDHQTVAQLGARLVLVTHAEAGGPCPPTRACPPEEASDYTEWDNRVAQTVEATVDRAFQDLP